MKKILLALLLFPALCQAQIVSIIDSSGYLKFVNPLTSSTYLWTSISTIGSAAVLGYVPTTTTVNGHALSGNVTVTPTDLSLVIGTNTQAYNANLTSIGALANAVGYLHNDGSGVFAYSTPAGAGTVTNTGTLTSNALMLGNGGTDSKVSTGFTTDGTSILTLGVAGASVGTVAFKNATSGTASLIPPTGALGTYSVTLPNAASTLPIFSQQATFSGLTAARTITFPDANFTAARTDAANTFTGHQTIEGVTSTGATGTGNFVFSASPTLTGTTTATTLTATTLTAVAGAGFQNMVVETSGSSATYNLPAELQITGAKFKITIIGGGGQGGGTNTTAGQMGGGGGSGGLVVVYLTYVAGQNTVTYTVGAGGSTSTGNATGQTGTNSSIVYNSVTYTASGGVGGLSGSSNGAGGAGGAASGGTLNIAGFPGASSGTMAATSNFQGYGGNTPLGYGQGGAMVSTAAGAAGLTGDGFGSGGGGGRNGTGTTARNGGAGKIGVVIIEY